MTDRVHLFVATPMLNYQSDGRYTRSLLNLYATCADLGWGFSWWNKADSLIPRARNWYLHDFLKGPEPGDLEKFGPYTHLLSIDADIVFDPRVVPVLVGTKHDVVCCAYPKKGINWVRVGDMARLYERSIETYAADYAINFIGGDRVPAELGCVPVLDAATGFLMTTRRAILEMSYAHPDRIYLNDVQGPTYGEAGIGLFDCYTEPDTLRPLSEDYAFSRRWQNTGGRVMLYLGPGCELGHIGSHTYRGNIYNWAQPIAPATHALESSLPEDAQWTAIDGRPYGDVMLERYEWAAEQLAGASRVADACCGPGYGLPILRRSVQSVTGFDRDANNIEVATDRGYGDVKLTPDIQGETLDGFDALCSLETVEHLPDPITWLRNLSPTVTRMVLSVPCLPTKHKNEHHLWDFTYQEVLNIVRAMGWTVKSHRPQDGGAVILVYAEREASGLVSAGMSDASPPLLGPAAGPEPDSAKGDASGRTTSEAAE